MPGTLRATNRDISNVSHDAVAEQIHLLVLWVHRPLVTGIPAGSNLLISTQAYQKS
jgi:hypothetical protein